MNLVSDVGRWLADQQRSLRRFDSHVVLSRASAYLLERSGVDRQTIQVCRLGTRHEPPQHRTYLDWHEQRRPMRVIFVGRLDAVKGVVTLVEAALHFGANELQLDVFGVSGDAESKLRDLTKRDHGPVRFLGALPPEQVVDRMAEYDFVAIPSQFFETGPFTAVEALQAGTPLIASDMPSLTEFIEHGRTGWLVQPGSVDAWAAALRTLMDHPDTARDISSQLAYPRTMRDVAREMFDLYSRALPANKSM